MDDNDVVSNSQGVIDDVQDGDKVYSKKKKRKIDKTNLNNNNNTLILDGQWRSVTYAAKYDEIVSFEELVPGVSDGDVSKPKLKKKKKRKRVYEEDDDDSYVPPASKWDEFLLHPSVLRGIHELGFVEPTRIQRLCLPLAIRDWRDIIGAAETGSGKTLAFGIPILHHLLSARLRHYEKFPNVPESGGVRALIITPTRELALQIVKHLKAVGKYTHLQTVGIVGGMALQKQARMLNKEPEIVVGTPGRLWEMMRSSKYPHLADLSKLRFLVLDEADRMLAKGRYPEMAQMLEHIENFGVADFSDPEFAAALMSGEPEGEDIEPEGEDIEPDEEELKKSTVPDWMMNANDDDAVYEEDVELDHGEHSSSKEEDEDVIVDVSAPSELNSSLVSAPSKEKVVRRQTFLFSATLSLSSEGRAEHGGRSSARSQRRVGGGKNRQVDMLKWVTEQVKFHRTPPVIVDVSTNDEAQSANTVVGSATLKLPSTLTQTRVECSDAEKDAYLYYFLELNARRTIIFLNSISGVRRLVGLLSCLRFPVWGIHAEMQQRQRIKNLERLSKNENGIVVCTDVGARGLDIPRVSYVVHYQLPRSAEIYVHRSGRTARAGADGMTLSLIGEHDQSTYRRLVATLHDGEATTWPLFDVQRSMLPAVHKRVKLAQKLDRELSSTRRVKSDRDWRARTAAAMDIILSEDEEEVDDHERTNRLRAEKQQAQRTKAMQANLDQLLSQPLLSRGTSRKFLTPHTRAQLAAVNDRKEGNTTRSKKKRKKNRKPK